MVWVPVFYEVREDYLAAYRAHGFRVFKIAEDARIDLASFALAGRKFQNLRTARNRAEKAGMRFSWHAGSGLAEDLLVPSREISRAWLADRHATEMTFDLGTLDDAAFARAEVCVARGDDGRPVAFATWLPYARGTGRGIDMMRHRAGQRGVMDAMIVEGLLEFQRRGGVEASLGNAPLANIAPEGFDQIEEKAIRSLFRKFDRYYGYKSLFEFKQKFDPRWKSRYVAYGGLARIVPVMLAIVQVHLPGGLLKFLRS